MRRFFFSLLILLTAFRGIAGDAMAYSMNLAQLQQSTSYAAGSVVATELIASSADSMTATGQFSLKKAAPMPCHEPASDADSDTPSHTCSTCMVCHSPVLQRASIVMNTPEFVAAYIARQDSTWASAELARQQKPPVS